jgi:hypothetical protein
MAWRRIADPADSSPSAAASGSVRHVRWQRLSKERAMLTSAHADLLPYRFVAIVTLLADACNSAEATEDPMVRQRALVPQRMNVRLSLPPRGAAMIESRRQVSLERVWEGGLAVASLDRRGDAAAAPCSSCRALFADRPAIKVSAWWWCCKRWCAQVREWPCARGTQRIVSQAPSARGPVHASNYLLAFPPSSRLGAHFAWERAECG